MRPRPGTACSSLRRSATPLLLGLALLPVSATAQDGAQNGDEAAIARLSVGQQISLDNGDLIGVTPLDMTFRSGTRSQTLEFGFSLPLTEGDPDKSGFVALGDRRANLSYRRFTRNASLEASLRYRETDLDREIFFDDVTNTLVTLDPGSLATSSARLGYAFGSQAKLGGEFSIEHSRRNYTNTIDPDLTDSRTNSVDGRIYLEPTPLIRARIIASASRTDSDGGTDSRISRLGAGASLQVDKVTNLDVEAAWSDIRRQDQGQPDENAKGLSVRLSGSRARPDGAYTFSLSSDPGTSGRRDNLMLGRSLETARYNLSFQLGATRFSGSVDPIFQIGYDRDLGPTSSITASLDRQSVVDDEGNEAINTNLAVGYTRALGDLSNLSTSIRYRQSQVQAGDLQDARSLAFSVNYNRSLTEDLALVAGYTMVRSKDGDGARNDDDRLFLGINRDFNFLP